MKRREFITLVGGAAATWPIVTRAQQAAMPVLGFLQGGGPPNEQSLAAFREGLVVLGYTEGRNLAIEMLVTEHYDRLPALTAELVRRPVAAIFAAGSANPAQAAKAATAEIPIVFLVSGDPVQLGLVGSLNQPGGNVTGVTYFTSTLLAKRIELLRELVPGATLVGFLRNPTNAVSANDTTEVQSAVRKLGQQLTVLNASTEQELDTAFSTAVSQHVDALLVGGDAFFNRRRGQIAALAARYKVPASYPTREIAVSGGLMSYGDVRLESFRQAGIYVGRVLRGEKPADLPVIQPTKFELVINLKTAKTLGLTVPPMLLSLADEVIE